MFNESIETHLLPTIVLGKVAAMYIQYILSLSQLVSETESAENNERKTVVKQAGKCS